MDIGTMQFDDLLRYFFRSRANMAIAMDMSVTTLRQWEAQYELTPAQRSRILGAAIMSRQVPREWLLLYAKDDGRSGARGAR